MSVRTAASAHSFVAGPVFGRTPFVVRVSVTVLTVVVTDALIVDVPGAADVSVTVQDPVAPTVRHGLPEIVPKFVVTVTGVPAGAFTNPVPGFTFTCTVSRWFVPTGFVAIVG